MKRFIPFWFALVTLIQFACKNKNPETPPAGPDTPSVNADQQQENDRVGLIRSELQAKFKDDLEKNLIDSLSRQFTYSEIDLNGDGKNEVFVGLTGPYFCGSGGCSFYLLDAEGKTLSDFSVSDYPVVVDSESSNGWKNLLISSGGKYHVIKFDGSRYPANPSTEPEATTAPGADLSRVLETGTPTYSF